MSKYFLVLVFFILQHTVTAQRFSKDEWHKGRVILTDGDTLSGRIKYDLQNNVIQLQLQNANENYAFSTHKIRTFEIIDNLIESYRRFVVLDYDLKNNNYKVPVFFEIIKEGNLTLLSRERLENYTESYNPYQTYTRLRLVYDYYFYDTKREKIILFDGKKRSLGPIFEPYSKEVKQYMKDDTLKPDKMADLARIVAYYNELSNQRSK